MAKKKTPSKKRPSATVAKRKVSRLLVAVDRIIRQAEHLRDEVSGMYAGAKPAKQTSIRRRIHPLPEGKWPKR